MQFDLEHLENGSAHFYESFLFPVAGLSGIKCCVPSSTEAAGRQASVLLMSTLLIVSLVGFYRCECCGAVFHSECKEKSVPCPRCVRRELQKKQKSFWRRLNVDESLEEACSMFELSYQNT